MSADEKPTFAMPGNLSKDEAVRLFSDTLRVTGVAHTGPELQGEPGLIGRRLGLLNGSSWITLWANYFGRMYLPGVQLINIGNEAVQVNFMEAHEKGTPELPPENILAFQRYAVDLVQLGRVDAILITCSTMNRSFPKVKEAVRQYGVPVLQIDQPMMARAVRYGGRVLVIATHGPTVESTRALLQEEAACQGRPVALSGALVEEAWHSLANGDVEAHNQVLARTIREQKEKEELSCVVLAQLSMSVFLLSHPDPLKEFGLPVLTSGQCGFEAVRKILLS